MISRLSKISIAVLASPIVLVALAALYLAVFGWNWARGPLERAVLSATGRSLVIAGDLDVRWGWPAIRVKTGGVTFANPSWAAQPQMVALDAADFTVDLPALLSSQLIFPTVHLTRPVVMLETASNGRKTWLFDRNQSNENAQIAVGQLTLDHGLLGFDEPLNKTQIRMEINTLEGGKGEVEFSATGHYKGMPVRGVGKGDSVLGLRDERLPYRLKVDATVGATGVGAEGTVTGLSTFSEVDLQLSLRGDSLAQLFPLLHVALPETRAYATSGHLQHSAQSWTYKNFTGRVGRSDVAGTLQVDLAGVRPMLRGEVVSRVLDLDDLGPVIGARAPGKKSKRVLPDLPFKTERWRAVDADVKVRANSILRAKALPLDQMTAHVQLHNAVLTLNPLDFSAAGGHLQSTITLDARKDEIQAVAKVQVRKIKLNKLLPTLVLAKASVGEINGTFDLAGHGNTVGRMLATSNGSARLRVAKGQISRLLMEQMGLHILEIVQLTLTGDKTVELRCAIADFKLKQGVLSANTLLLDTAVSTVVGSGQINLADETLNLTLVPHTRPTSLVALRSPIYVRGTLGAPVVALDKQRIVARAAGALALGLINPVLALVPLIEAGPGLPSECAKPPVKSLKK